MSLGWSMPFMPSWLIRSVIGERLQPKYLVGQARRSRCWTSFAAAVASVSVGV